MDFSPFQCEKCMRVYTRKSLYTRHLKEVSPEGTARRTRQCPNKETEPDKTFHIRKRTYEALWAIQLTQGQVDDAINIIKQHNGTLPSRRRRTQNINVPDDSVPVAAGRQLPQSAGHPFHSRDERGKSDALPKYLMLGFLIPVLSKGFLKLHHRLHLKQQHPYTPQLCLGL